MKLIENASQLQDWGFYKPYMKEQLKRLEEDSTVYVSRKKMDFSIDGKPWAGFGVLIGKRADMSAKKLRKDGVICSEGQCRKEGKTLIVSGLKPEKLTTGMLRTFLKLKLGYKVAPLDDDDAADSAGSEGSDLQKRADRINKAVTAWNKTEEAATKELRKLQRAVLQLNDPNGKHVIQGLEGILKRLDTVDDEAREAADAAARGDTPGFEAARQDFLNKMKRILDYVEKDELIRDADSNPGVQIKIRETISTSLHRLMKVI